MPASLSDQVLEKFEEDGGNLLASFLDLWDNLVSAAICHKEDEIICILDALNECEDSGRHQLIDSISKVYSGTTAPSPVLKFLLTSRLYLDVKRGFQHLEHKLPTIHLSRENEEVSKISREIDLVIRRRVADIGTRLQLHQEEQKVFEEVTWVPNRTYLWVHLIFDVIQNSILNTPFTRSRKHLTKHMMGSYREFGLLNSPGSFCIFS